MNKSLLFFSLLFPILFFNNNTKAADNFNKELKRDKFRVNAQLGFDNKSDEEIRSNENKKNKINSIIYLSVGLVSGAGADDFFTQYNGKYLGGKVNHFTFTPLFGMGTKFDVLKGYRIGLIVNYFNAVLQDGYKQTVENTTIERNITQDIKYDNFLGVLTFEIIPYSIQFKTYTGGGIGASFSHIYWKEVLSSSKADDERKGGIHIDEKIISPAIKIYTGIELGFDKKADEMFLGSLIIDVSYNYEFRKVEIFKKLARQFENVPPGWNNKFYFLNGYLSLNLAISFNFNYAKT